VPIIVGLGIFTLMTTWYQGRRIVLKLLRRGSLPMDLFLNSVADHKPVRVPGTAIFLTSDPEGAPLVLLHHLKHNKVLHEQVVLLSVLSANVPEIPETERVLAVQLSEGFWRVKARYGFMETPNVPHILGRCSEAGIKSDKLHTTYYLGRERLIPNPHSKAHLASWRKKLFIFMSRNSRTATEFFGIPSNRVVELGAQLEF
jgi:KUP system potassium uptake protein